MKTLIHAAVVTLCAASTTQAQQAVQWKVSDGGNGHWYALMSGSMCQTEFSNRAAAGGAHLATISSSGENDFVHGLINVGSGFWTYFGWVQNLGSSGFSEPGGGWGWGNGEPVTYVGWGANEPNNGGSTGIAENYAIMFPGLSYWVDARECVADQAVIEFSADCNNDGIIDYGQCRDGTLPDYNGNNIPDCCERGEECVVGSYPLQWRADGGGNGHWYQARQCDCCFAQAAAIATSIGGQLASIDEAGEQSRVVIVVPSTRAAKLGGFREPAADQYLGWQWLSGRPFNPAFISWADGNPGCCGDDQYWLFLQATPGGGFGLHDGFNCAWPGSDFMLIEWDADCNNDGVVDYGQILQGQLADLNTDGVPDICQQPICADADLFRDFNVNGADLGILLSQWGPNTPLTVSDINGDGVVSGVDLGLLLSFWGPCPN
jgi:hypothetical protein